jgi:hypothetical protein
MKSDIIMGNDNFFDGVGCMVGYLPLIGKVEETAAKK